MIFFQNCHTEQDLKIRYKELAKIHHPDRGGETETMQKINTEYSYLIKNIWKLKDENLDESELEEKIFNDERYRNAINLILNLPNIEIELVGIWIWVTGNTFEVKDKLKEAGFFFASKKIAWYFRTDENKVKNKKEMSLEQIKVKYGSSKIKTDSQKLLINRAGK